MNQYIAHHGVPGQKHGVRRYQYEDGSLTPLGREHYGVGTSKALATRRGYLTPYGERVMNEKYEKGSKETRTGTRMANAGYVGGGSSLITSLSLASGGLIAGNVAAAAVIGSGLVSIGVPIAGAIIAGNGRMKLQEFLDLSDVAAIAKARDYQKAKDETAKTSLAKEYTELAKKRIDARKLMYR